MRSGVYEDLSCGGALIEKPVSKIFALYCSMQSLKDHSATLAEHIPTMEMGVDTYILEVPVPQPITHGMVCGEKIERARLLVRVNMRIPFILFSVMVLGLGWGAGLGSSVPNVRDAHGKDAHVSNSFF
jgi:hypothetical protein